MATNTSHRFNPGDWVKVKAYPDLIVRIDSTVSHDGGKTVRYTFRIGDHSFVPHLGEELSLYTEHQQAMEFFGEDYFA